MKTENLFIDLSPKRKTILTDVLTGLSLSQKKIDPKYLYDQRGSELFEEICTLAEYYPARTESSILRENAEDMARLIGEDVILIEPGAGEGKKIKLLLDHLPRVTYIPIEISLTALNLLVAEIKKTYPRIELKPIYADFNQEKTLEILKLNTECERKKVIFFPGSTIGNFDTHEAIRFLRKIGKMAGHRGGLLIGVDLKKKKDYFLKAYDDSKGVTAAFNKNVLSRLNKEADADFCRELFDHKVFYDETLGRVEMHLMSNINQSVRVHQSLFHFREGESIHTESSYKYTTDEFIKLGARAQWKIVRTWSDSERLFCLYYFERN